MLKSQYLFDFYRNMLTSRQAESIDLYYNEDLSLAEISEHMGITHQASAIIFNGREAPCLILRIDLGLHPDFLK